jgi:4-hydroxy-tetrahydrodipicolinate synthase
MVRRYRAGDTAEAARLNDQTAPAIDILKVVGNPIAIKAALNLLGREVGGHRLPLVSADDAEVAQIRALLGRLGLAVAA